MPKNTDAVQIWIPRQTRDALKQISSANGEFAHETVQRLVQAEVRNVPGKKNGGPM